MSWVPVESAYRSFKGSVHGDKLDIQESFS